MASCKREMGPALHEDALPESADIDVKMPGKSIVDRYTCALGDQEDVISARSLQKSGGCCRFRTKSLSSVRFNADVNFQRHILVFVSSLIPLHVAAFSSISPGLSLSRHGGLGAARLQGPVHCLTGRLSMDTLAGNPNDPFQNKLRLLAPALPSSRLRKGLDPNRATLVTMSMSSSAAGGNISDTGPQESSKTETPESSESSIVPKWLQNSFLQFVICAGLYAFHVFVLCQRSLTIPENVMKVVGFSEAVSVPWESVVGTAILFCMATLGSKRIRASMSQSLSGTALLGKESLPTKVEEERKKDLPETFILLGLAYLGSGYVGQAIDLILCAMAALGVPLTLGMCRALQVLLSHLFWVVLGSQILQSRTGDFYTSKKWFQFDLRGKNLFLAVIAGYWLTSYISTIAININELLHMADLPGLKQLHDMLNQLPESATETVLDGIKNPEGGDLAARAVGAVGPCFTGPIWEEVLYRGFLLQALTLFMKLPTAVDVSSLVFALNHMNARAFAHLYIVGWLWSVFYIKSRNLMVPILIHMMWNGRTFLAPI